ncbi:unnamed protein product [Rotaria sp. Silwood2]|nr:unnamed protein product [Rotaria sp. Silwood2]CAF4319661.1 unnamed protein product [Rotaria sp. Silwood2]
MTSPTVILSVTLSKTSKNAPLLIYNGYSYTIDRRSETKISWKCKYSRKYFCHARLHKKLNYEFIKTVGEHENHIGNSRCEAIRKYYEQLKQKSEQNQTNPHSNSCGPTNMRWTFIVSIKFVFSFPCIIRNCEYLLLDYC